MKFRHFLITRFNITTGYSTGTELQDNWLNDRCDLFEKYCLPSVASQSCPNFSWIILMHEKTPLEHISRVKKALSQRLIQFDILLVNIDADKSLRDYFISLPSPPEFIITSRLDNDDAIHCDFIDCIQKLFFEQEYEFIEFINGYSYSVLNNNLRQRVFEGNPFVSLIEKYSNSITTVHCGPHLKLREKGKFKVLKKPVGWMQMIHGGNVWNRETGELVTEDVHAIKEKFGFRVE
ncbi:hypothetical protein ABIE26_002534 [Pedobacter africanus]|uniref:Uncharacterized protein n=1 Tax=Pedobacter africanus TaxID=151894 RepID=A0ACC6KXS6_9SPHI|nr:glycosyltransferase [Pedobacter africanus]MDR6784077.1 hypothetical protein [Pedobacter africanus]